MYVKKARSKWGLVYQVGFIGGKKADSVHVDTIQEAWDTIGYILRKIA
jgi:hypothetical protein